MVSQTHHQQPGFPDDFRGLPRAHRGVSKGSDAVRPTQWYMNAQRTEIAIVRESAVAREAIHLSSTQWGSQGVRKSLSLSGPMNQADSVYILHAEGAEQAVKLGEFLERVLETFESCGAGATINELELYQPRRSSQLAELRSPTTTWCPPPALVIAQNSELVAHLIRRGDVLVLSCHHHGNEPALSIDFKAQASPDIERTLRALAEVITSEGYPLEEHRTILARTEADLQISVSCRGLSSGLIHSLDERRRAYSLSRLRGTVLFPAGETHAAIDLFRQGLPFRALPPAPPGGLIHQGILCANDRIGQVALWMVAVNDEVVRLHWDRDTVQETSLLSNLVALGTTQSPLQFKSCFTLQPTEHCVIPGGDLYNPRAHYFCKELQHFADVAFSRQPSGMKVPTTVFPLDHGYTVTWFFPHKRSVSIMCRDIGPGTITVKRSVDKQLRIHSVGFPFFSPEAWIRIFQAAQTPGIFGRFTPLWLSPVTRAIRNELAMVRRKSDIF